MQKLARAVVGTNNIDNCSRYCQSPATTGLFRTVGYGGDSGSISDIEKASLVLIMEQYCREPSGSGRARQARHKLRGQKLIVADLREHEMARRADVFLHPKRGQTGLAVGDQPLLAREQPGEHQVPGRMGPRPRRVREKLGPFTLEFASRTCGLPAETLEKVARMIAEAESMCILWAMGVTQHARVGHFDGDVQPSVGKGNYMRPGTGLIPCARHRRRSVRPLAVLCDAHRPENAHALRLGDHPRTFSSVVRGQAASPRSKLQRNGAKLFSYSSRPWTIRPGTWCSPGCSSSK